MYTSEEVKQNEKWSKLNGEAATVSNTIVSTYLPIFAINVVGVTNYQLGWINSMPSLISLLILLPAAWSMNQLERKREFTFVVILLMRVFIAFIAITPFVHFMNSGWWLIVAIAIMNVPTALASLSWQSFIGDLIPDNRRASFFSERNRLATIVGLITSVFVGFMLNLSSKSDPNPYVTVFLVAVLFGVIESLLIFKHKEIPLKSNNEKIQVKKLKWFRLFQNRPYVTFLVCAFVFQFGWQMAWPIFNIYNVKIAGATAFWISLFTVCSQIGQIVSFKWWGRYSEKYGHARALLLSCIGMGLTTTITIFSTNLYYLLLTNFISGIALSGITLLLFNELLAVSPIEERTNGIAYYQLMVGAVGFISPQVGVLLYETLGLSFSMNVSTIIRIIGGILFFLAPIYLYRNKPRKKKAFA